MNVWDIPTNELFEVEPQTDLVKLRINLIHLWSNKDKIKFIKEYEKFRSNLTMHNAHYGVMDLDGIDILDLDQEIRTLFEYQDLLDKTNPHNQVIDTLLNYIISNGNYIT